MRSPLARIAFFAAMLWLPVPVAHAAAVFSRLDLVTSRLLAATAGVSGGLERSASGATLLAVDEDAVAAFRAAGRGVLSVPDAEGGSVELELEPYELFSPGAGPTYTDETGRHAFDADVSLFRGRVAGEDGSWVVLAMGGGGIQAVIERAGRRFTLSPAQRTAAAAAVHGAGVHAFAPEGDLTASVNRFECGINADNEARYTMPRPDPEGLEQRMEVAPEGTELNATRLTFKVAVDCDFEIYSVKFGANLSAATTYIMTVLGTVNLIYERDVEATLNFPFVNFWTTAADPYNAGTTGGALDELQIYWGANMGHVTRNVAHLISGRGLGGGIAYVGTVCGGPGYGVSAIDATYSYPTATTTWDIVVVAHELGHNFGSHHTHSCQWAGEGYVPAGSTLDSCVASEGGCATYTNHVPPNKGTIMSYCHLTGGTATGVRLDLHPVCVSRMRGILGGCSTPPLPFPPKNPVSTTIASGLRLSWTAGGSASVLRTSVYRSRLPLDLGSEFIGNSLTTQYDTPGLGIYYYRMRHVRSADSSSFSAEVKDTACALVSAPPVTVGSQPTGALSEDFNEDGIQDIALVTTFGGNLVVMLGQGAGGVGNGTFSAPVNTVTGASPTCLAPLDVNGDGILDLIVGVQSDFSLKVHFGQGVSGVGNGTFGAVTPLAALSFSPTAIASADFDEDGISDLAVAGGGSFVATLRGMGTAGVPSGTFATPVSVPTATNSRGVLPYDFNGDGITDLAVTGASLRILMGNGSLGRGDGTFATSVSYSVGSSPNQMATADFNADGIADIAVCNNGSSTVSVLLGNGTLGVPTGTFAAAIPASSGSGPNAVNVGDWDDNGIPDMAVAGNSTLHSSAVLLGRGNGTFEPAQTFPAGGNTPSFLAVNDFNEDGTPDLLTCNLGSQSVTRQLAGCAGVMSNAIVVTAPNGGEVWNGGDEHTLSWTRAAGVMTVDVQISTDGGANWRTLARGLTGSSYAWSATGPTTTQARLRVVDSHSAQFADTSDADFTLYDESALAVGDDDPARLALLGAWPNPARQDLSVSLSLPAGGVRGRLELLDLAGRRMAGRDLAGLAAGRHQVKLLERRFVAPGVYLLRLTHGAQVRSMKVAVLR